MRERRQKRVDRHKETKAKADKVRENEEDDKHCKDRAPSSGLFRAQTPSDSSKKTGDQH